MSLSRHVRHVFIALLLMVGVVGTTALPAQAAAGSIVGTVKDTDHQAIENVRVMAFRWNSGWQETNTYNTTNSSGGYAVGGLTPGKYILFFADDSGAGAYQQVWSNGTTQQPVNDTSAGVITVVDGVATTFNTTLPDGPTAHLTGHVENSRDHTGLDGVVVEARPAGQPSADIVSTAITYGGDYDLYTAPGSYDLTFSHLSGDYTDSALLNVHATKNTETSLPLVSLTPGGNFSAASGTVQVTTPGAGNASGFAVTLYRVVGTIGVSDYDIRSVDVTSTDSSGHYKFSKLVPGKRYVIEVEEPGYTEMWLGNADEWEKSTILVPTASDADLATINVQRRTAILGHVADASGDAVGVSVDIYRWNGTSFEETGELGYTDGQGRYVVYVEQTGTYALYAATSESATLGSDRWFGSAEMPKSPTAAGTFQVNDKAHTIADTTLVDATTIHGVVKDSVTSPNGVSGVTVTAAHWDGAGWTFSEHNAYSDATGHYTLKLTEGPGRWAIQFNPSSNSPAGDQWLGGTFSYPDPSNLNSSNSVVVNTEGEAVTAPTATLRDAPVVAGQVVASNGGAAIPGVRVRGYVWTGYDWGGGDWYQVSTTFTDATGHYKLRAAPGEKFTVRAAKPGYYRSFIGGSSEFPAEPVLSGNGINAVMTSDDDSTAPIIRMEAVPGQTGSLHGTVTSPDGPVSLVGVTACPVQAGPACHRTRPASDGTWEIADLPVGDWKLSFWPDSDAVFSASITKTVASGVDTPADVTLGAPAKLPAEASVTQAGVTQTRGVPTVYYAEPMSVSVPGAPGAASPTYTVRLNDGGPVISGPLTYQDGKYVATIPAFFPRHGEATVTTNIPQQGGGTVGFDLYIDPSGTIVDQYGQPIEGATALLQRSENDTKAGPYSDVPQDSTIMSPSNRDNSMTTDKNGAFHWDVAPGWYRVLASKPVTSCQPNTSEDLQVPPAQVDIEIKLSGCPAPSPTRAPSISGGHSVGSVLTAVAGSWKGTWGTPTYQWKRNGMPIWGATGSQYRLTPADAGQAISVAQSQRHSADYAPVTADSAWFRASKASSTGAIRMYAAKIKRKQRGTAIVTVRASGLYPTGRVTVLVDGGKYRAYGTLYNSSRGILRVLLPKLKKGTHSVRAAYGGSTNVAPSNSGTTYLRVR